MECTPWKIKSWTFFQTFIVILTSHIVWISDWLTYRFKLFVCTLCLEVLPFFTRDTSCTLVLFKMLLSIQLLFTKHIHLLYLSDIFSFSTYIEASRDKLKKRILKSKVIKNSCVKILHCKKKSLNWPHWFPSWTKQSRWHDACHGYSLLLP